MQVWDELVLSQLDSSLFWRAHDLPPWLVPTSGHLSPLPLSHSPDQPVISGDRWVTFPVEETRSAGTVLAPVLLVLPEMITSHMTAECYNLTRAFRCINFTPVVCSQITTNNQETIFLPCSEIPFIPRIFLFLFLFLKIKLWLSGDPESFKNQLRGRRGTVSRAHALFCGGLGSVLGISSSPEYPTKGRANLA